MLLMFQTITCCTRLTAALDDWIRSLLLKSECVEFISSLVHQETGHNYGQFKSDVRWNISTSTTDLVREFSRQQPHHDEDPTNFTAPTKTVSIGLYQYGLILSG
jgi:hypothetical protein